MNPDNAISSSVVDASGVFADGWTSLDFRLNVEGWTPQLSLVCNLANPTPLERRIRLFTSDQDWEITLAPGDVKDVVVGSDKTRWFLRGLVAPPFVPSDGGSTDTRELGVRMTHGISIKSLEIDEQTQLVPKPKPRNRSQSPAK